jgi:hypothetical protein
VQPQFLSRAGWKWDADADREHSRSDNVSAAETREQFVLRHAVAFVRDDAIGGKVQIEEQEPSGLVAGLPYRVGAGLAVSLWRHVILWR